jgi:hypothetical protein
MTTQIRSPCDCEKCWHAEFGCAVRSMITDPAARYASEGNRQVWAHLDRSLACWRQRCPDLDLRVVAVGGSAVNCLTKHAADIQLVVVGRDGRRCG